MVKDDEGNPLSVAHVNVYQTNPTAHDIFPADHQADTDAEGIATFEIRVKTGESCGSL